MKVGIISRRERDETKPWNTFQDTPQNMRKCQVSPNNSGTVCGLCSDAFLALNIG